MELGAYQRALIPLGQPVGSGLSLGPGFRMAAVLLGLCRWEEPVGRLFAIRRSRQLRDHGGQIGFPGGKVEEGDASLAETALRETQEEIGLEPARVTLLGRLSPVPTPSRFLIVPFVGFLNTEAWVPRVDPAEVDELLYLERRALEDKKNYLQRGYFERAGYRVPRHEYQICEPPLWGASAHMVHELMTRWRKIRPRRTGS